MLNDIAYPSEILDAGTKTISLDIKSSAWMRFLARMFDYSLMYLVLYFTRQYLVSLPFYVFYYFPIEHIVFIPIEALCLRFAKGTLGKQLLQIRVTQNNKPSSLKTCLQRAIKVYFRGMGLGVFWIYFFAMSTAYTKLIQTGTAVWDDEEKTQVQHKIPSSTNILIAVFTLIFVFFFKRYS